MYLIVNSLEINLKLVTAYNPTEAILPISNRRLQKRYNAGDEKYGADELTELHWVAANAEAPGKDERNSDGRTKHGQVVL